MGQNPWKRWAAGGMLLLALGALTGCSGVISERPMEDVSNLIIEPGTTAPKTDEYADEKDYATLYFPSADGERLVPVLREVTCSGGKLRAQAVLEALVKGPQEGERGVVWPKADGISERMLELSGGVATVNLPARCRVLEPQALYTMRLAVANTLCELPEVSYVNVLVGGREEGLDLGATMPVGTLSAMEDMETLSRYNRLDDQRMSGAGFTKLTTLYFPTADGQYLMPVVRSVAYAEASPIDCLYTILEELGKGTGLSLAAQGVPAPMDYIEEMPEIVRTEDGAFRAIEIRFAGTLEEALRECGLTMGLYTAMLTDTLMGFVPGVEGLQIIVDEDRLTGLSESQTPGRQAIDFETGVITREDFQGYIGAPVTLYVQSAEPGKITRVNRIIDQQDQNNPRRLLEAMMRLSEETGLFALPRSLTPADILAVRVEEKNVAVNLSAAFGEALLALPEEQARASVYAMVNTLTEGRNQQGVVFFFEGKQLGELAGGLNLSGRMVRNPGMVVK